MNRKCDRCRKAPATTFAYVATIDTQADLYLCAECLEAAFALCDTVDEYPLGADGIPIHPHDEPFEYIEIPDRDPNCDTALDRDARNADALHGRSEEL